MRSNDPETAPLSKKAFCGDGGARDLSTFAKYIDHLKTNEGPVLDVGCGRGMVVRALKELQVDAVGIDIVFHKWGDMPAAVADGFALPFRDGTFAAAGCYAVIEHLSEPDALIREMARVIRPRGKMVIGCPNMRGVLMSHPGDFVTHRGGAKQRVKNLFVYLTTLLRSFFSKKEIPFEIVNPPDMTKAPLHASDYNALRAVNFVTVKHFLRRLGFKIVYISAGMEYAQSRFKQNVIDAVDKVPILREMFGGLFIVAVKK